jgi:fluoride exporter
MNLLSAILVSVGAAVGSLFRYGAGRVVAARTHSDFPWGTWLINLCGTFLLGVFFRELESAHHELDWWMLLGTGMCGGFTTFSTMSVEALQLLRTRKGLAVVYLASSVILGFLIAYYTQWI